MKQHIYGLLDRYREADWNTRLDLYLQYPDLRGEFLEIDRDGLCREWEDRVHCAAFSMEDVIENRRSGNRHDRSDRPGNARDASPSTRCLHGLAVPENLLRKFPQ